MADRQPMIVIKKINVVAGGGHGGSWKVALADFMTSLMAFFLVMWLVGQGEPTKKAVAQYFSTPSIVEYNYSTFGVVLTLEKLFLDFINDPLKAMQSFVEPMSANPDILEFEHDEMMKIFLIDQLGEVAKNVNVAKDVIEFDIPDHQLFVPGTAEPGIQFVPTVEKIKKLVTGVANANIDIISNLYYESIPDASKTQVENIANKRLDIVNAKVKGALEHDSVTVNGSIQVKNAAQIERGKLPAGFIRLRIAHKESAEIKSKNNNETYGDKKAGMSIYDNFVHQLTNKKKPPKPPPVEPKQPLQEQQNPERRE